ncbi:hypothetical protein ACROYT_G020067 [Oculina patagonica]
MSVLASVRLVSSAYILGSEYVRQCAGRTKELCLPGNINNNNLRLTGLNRTFQSPQSDYSYHSLLCNWLITVPEGNIVKLTFDRFVLPSHCIAEYVEVFDGNNTYSKSIGKFCGFYFDDTPKHPVRSSGQYMLVRFKSVYFLGGSSEGFKATFTAENEAICPYNRLVVNAASYEKTLTSPYYPSNPDNGLNCNWLLEVDNGLLSGGYKHVVREEEASGICRSSDGRNKVRRLSGSSGTFLSPNFPYYYPDDVRCIWTISVPAGNVVKLRFENFELNLDPEDCKRSTKTSKDYVQIHDGQVPESKELALYCGNFLSMGPSDVYSTGRYMTVIFQSISDGQLENRGFKARFEAVDPESATSDQLCFSGNVNNNNLKITASHGTLQSPLRGAVYPPDLSCDWLITVPEGKTVKLSFDRFDLQRSSWSGVCTADYVEILDGKYNYSESKGKFCAHRPDDITSSGRYMQLRFRSDSTETDFIYSGFKASFIAEDKPSTTVGVPASSKEDYVEVRDGNGLNSESKGRFCGLTAPDDIRSNRRYMLVAFRSDSDYSNYGGFKATFTAEEKPSSSSHTVIIVVVTLAFVISLVCCVVCVVKRKKKLNSDADVAIPMTTATTSASRTTRPGEVQHSPRPSRQAPSAPALNLNPLPPVGYAPVPTNPEVPPPAYPYPLESPPHYPGDESAPQYPPPGQSYPWQQTSSSAPAESSAPTEGPVEPSAPPESP